MIVLQGESLNIFSVNCVKEDMFLAVLVCLSSVHSFAE